MLLTLESGPASIIQAKNIGLLDLAPTEDDQLYVHQESEDHRLFFYGNFKGFHTYALVTHTKFKINKDSVRLLDESSFEAELIFEDEEGDEKSQLTRFGSPMAPLSNVSACKYGRDYDCFEFSFSNGAANQKFPCDLVFVTHYAKDLKYSIPLCIEYIGMAAKNGRTAQDRLGEGHDKLQTILAKLNARDQFKSASIILYKPGELDCNEITFEQVVNILEASLIQHFKPTPLNVEHLNFPNNRTKLISILKNIGAVLINVKLESPKGTSLYSMHKTEKLEEHLIFVQIP
ncbi:hypothetical protein NJR55_13295 [Idiomarina sp. M1R2S28]|uniref:Uncharacterized protein n=1 Tax=Idiomarina rhizosphaerae TaxID=2961572 RepID=A0A9X2FZJ8_9GAMM|nr:hypothetical protein [Idiomarina rhizosphaerae]MCP1340555.1 hypothetical protein [Idiomarina rhizosphaerae]